MAKIRIHEIAKELGYDSKEIIEKANELGLNIKTASNAVEPEVAAGIYEYIQTKIIPEAFKKNLKQDPVKKAKAAPKEEKKEEKSPKEVETKAPAKVVEEVKPEPKTPEESKENIQESLASATLAKRRGLVIVKKKKDEEEAAKKEEPKASTPSNEERLSLKTMFSNADENLKKK
ncbi:translation initiation factor IF-2, partial [Campylobacter coli]